ncbi:hypothetical protein [Luteimonas sp. A478]
MTLQRRILLSGCASSILYVGLLLLILASGKVKTFNQAAPAALLGIAIAFAIGSLAFGLIPHFLSNLMERFVASTSSTFDLLNKASLAIALVSILIGVTASLLLIFGVSQATRPLLVAITLLAGSAATMCSLKFFFTNRNSE